MDYSDDDSEEISNGGPLPRIKLDTLQRVRREMSVLYREGKLGRRNTQDVSRLANVLFMISRIIEGGELEKRLAELERALAARTGR
jgi:hypothetical protein